MGVTIKLPTQLRSVAGGAAEASADGATVGEVLEGLYAQHPELRERLRPAFPAGRWGSPEDIAAVVALLVSPDSAWITGQVIDAEGGFRR